MQLKQKTYVAKKIHQDDGYSWFEGWERVDCASDEEWQLLQDARKRDWKILPGMTYEYIVSVIDGEFMVYKSTPELNKLGTKYDIWENY